MHHINHSEERNGNAEERRTAHDVNDVIFVWQEKLVRVGKRSNSATIVSSFWDGSVRLVMLYLQHVPLQVSFIL